LEENVRQEKNHAREVQESLNQEQKIRAELENHVKLQSQTLADLEKQRHTLQWRCSFLEDQLEQFLYVEPFFYFDSCNTETSAVLCS
jgi:septal ring factor EnvC (AmiA/AmiB activator)